ncbi:uncharacterized protein LOC124662988 [Lolium rigidum]|uniref:uncharacterized protein LOC124662988 n=1 Tax=Lolium rigidum TaxID=89674 RepID=UPI001F5D8DA6|nr:uncharacterized protein LOC124662988 [Lolium rigidum]
MTHKRRLAPEQEAAPSPRKRLRQAVFLVMRMERRARAVTAEQMAQMVRLVQLDMAKLFVLLMVLVLRIGSMESMLLQLPNMVRGLVAEELADFHRSLTVSMQDMIQSVRQKEEPQAASLPNGVNEPSTSRVVPQGLPEAGGSSGVVRLRFVGADRPEDPLFTRCPVEWQNGENPRVAIFRNEKQITGGDLSKVQIEILPVNAEFFTERGQDDFTKEEFNKHIHMCSGKETVLATITLRNGEADLGSIIFTETSHLKKLRLTARVKRQDLTVRVQEAITDPFVVKDIRSRSNAKSNLPSKGDAVHTLKGISKNGKHFAALEGKNITTVKHLMRHYHKDKSSLQELTGMKEKSWSTMIEHASTCAPGDEIFSYRVTEENCEVLFNDLYDLVGIIINGQYVPVRNLDKYHQRKVEDWKISAYKKFDEQENSGGLAADYFMSNDDCPVREKPLNNESCPSVQARPTWKYPNDMAAQQEFGEQYHIRQPNGFSLAEVLANNNAGPSNQEAPLNSQHTVGQDLGQHGPSMPQNGTLCSHRTQGNILNGQGSLPAQPTMPSFNFPPVPEDDWITRARLIGQQNGYLSSSATDAPGTSFPVTDGVSQATSLLNQAEDDSFSELFEKWLGEEEARGADQDIIPANNAKLPNSNNQFHG